MEVESPQDKTIRNSLMIYQGSQDIYGETGKVEYMTFMGVRSGDLRPPLRQLSSTHQGATPCHADLLTSLLLEALPCWMEKFICPAAGPAPEISAL